LRTHLAADYAGTAKCLELTHNLPQAIEIQSKATAILDQISKSNPGSAALSEYLGEATNRLATYRLEHGESAAALETYRKAHLIFASLMMADPKNFLAKSNFGFSDNGIAQSLVVVGNPAAATRVLRESIATFEEMSPRTTSDRYLRTGLAQAYSGLGEAYSVLATGKQVAPNPQREYWEEARAACQKSLALWREKEKRGELESGERTEPSQTAQCVATTETHLRNLGVKQGVRR
jgi:tetratricopeptide (TPR) repeat protein